MGDILKGKKWVRIQSFALVLITVLTVPFLYQNCGQVDFAEYPSVSPTNIAVDPNVGIGVEVRNGAGTVVANGGSLCAGGANATQSRVAIISIATSLSADTYYCRRVRPSTDNEFWNCEDAKSLGGSSTGGFGRIPGSDDTLAALGYNNLPNGTYELEVSAEGETAEGGDWTTLAIPVSFVVQDCSGGGGPDVSNVTTTTQQVGNPRTPGTPDNPVVTTTTQSPVNPGVTTTTTIITVTEPKCGDIDRAQAGYQPFDCGSWTYNPSAHNVRNPSRSRCCIEPGVTTTTTTQQPVNPGVTTTTTRRSTTTTRGPTTTLLPTCSSWNAHWKCQNAGYTGMAPNPPQGVNTASQCCVTGPTTTTTTSSTTTTTTITDPPLYPTCADTNTSQSGNQRFNCGSWTYNMSADNSINPSRSVCCIQPEATCADTNTSQSGNQRFNCGDWTYNTSANNTTNPNRSRCCIKPSGPVMCSDQITESQCHAQSKARIPGKKCAGSTCTVEECCGPNCATEQINCAANGKIGRGSWPWPRFSGSETVTDVINENTCCFTPRCEQHYSCRRLDTVPPTWDCSPNQDLGSHVRFTCPSGQEFKPQGACDVNRTTGAVECSAENCCSPSSSTSSTTSTTFTTPPTSIVIPPIDPPYNN